jgi:hypothetical protein
LGLIRLGNAIGRFIHKRAHLRWLGNGGL